MPVIEFFGVSTPSTDKLRLAAFVQRLRELGWIEGRCHRISLGGGTRRARCRDCGGWMIASLVSGFLLSLKANAGWRR